jgi:hypothetical protein
VDNCWNRSARGIKKALKKNAPFAPSVAREYTDIVIYVLCTWVRCMRNNYKMTPVLSTLKCVGYTSTRDWQPAECFDWIEWKYVLWREKKDVKMVNFSKHNIYDRIINITIMHSWECRFTCLTNYHWYLWGGEGKKEILFILHDNDIFICARPRVIVATPSSSSYIGFYNIKWSYMHT